MSCQPEVQLLQQALPETTWQQSVIVMLVQVEQNQQQLWVWDSNQPGQAPAYRCPRPAWAHIWHIIPAMSR
jgi:hypothetical protein